MKPTANQVARAATLAAHVGYTYDELDCQAFVEHCVRQAGGRMDYLGTNDMARRAAWLGTLDEARAQGRLVPGAGLLIREATEANLPARYAGDGLGDFSHVGLYVGENALTDTDKNGRRRACDVVHSSATMGRVAGSTLQNGWTHALWFSEIDYAVTAGAGAGADGTNADGTGGTAISDTSAGGTGTGNGEVTSGTSTGGTGAGTSGAGTGAVTSGTNAGSTSTGAGTGGTGTGGTGVGTSGTGTGAGTGGTSTGGTGAGTGTNTSGAGGTSTGTGAGTSGTGTGTSAVTSGTNAGSTGAGTGTNAGGTSTGTGGTGTGAVTSGTNAGGTSTGGTGTGAGTSGAGTGAVTSGTNAGNAGAGISGTGTGTNTGGTNTGGTGTTPVPGLTAGAVPAAYATVTSPDGGPVKLRKSASRGESLYWLVGAGARVRVERTRDGWSLVTALCTDGYTRRAWMMDAYLRR